jgi:hypothetical protein
LCSQEKATGLYCRAWRIQHTSLHHFVKIHFNIILPPMLTTSLRRFFSFVVSQIKFGVFSNFLCVLRASPIHYPRFDN